MSVVIKSINETKPIKHIPILLPGIKVLTAIEIGRGKRDMKVNLASVHQPLTIRSGLTFVGPFPGSTKTVMVNNIKLDSHGITIVIFRLTNSYFYY